MSALADRPRAHRSRIDDLRRLDWRFLLPTTDSSRVGDAVLIGGDGALADVARSIGFVERIAFQLPFRPGSVDLVAVLGGRDEDPSGVARALRPGGLAYWEVDRRRSLWRTPRRLAAELAAAGLEVIQGYAVRPHLAGAELYLPLQSLAAVRWYVDSVYIPSHPTQLIAKWVSRRLLGNPRLFAAALPFHVAVAQKPPLRGVTLPHRLAAAARRPGAIGPPAMLNHGGTRAVFIYCNEDSRPAFIAKVPKVRDLIARTEREQQVLRQLHETLSPDIAAAIPGPLALTNGGSHAAGLEAGQVGVSMARRSARLGASTRDRLDDLAAAASWITRLHTEHQLGLRAWDDDLIEDVLDRPVGEYERLFGATAAERALFARVRARAETLCGTLPVVWEHGDYTVWNVLRREASRDGATAAGVAVLDWEGAAPGLPFVDLFRFAVHWTELAGRRSLTLDRRALFTRTLFGDATTAGRVVRSTLDQYVRELSLDPRIEPVLVTRLYVDLAVRRHQISVESGATPDDPRAGNPALHMVGHLASFTDRLLAERAAFDEMPPVRYFDAR